MKIIQMSVAVMLLVSAGFVFAQPALVDQESFICPNYPIKYEEYLTYQDFCYRVELACGDHVGGSIHTNLADDGGVGVNGDVSDPSGFCFMIFNGHVGTTKIVHSCVFNSGEAVELEIKAVNLRHCAKDNIEFAKTESADSVKIKICHVPSGNHVNAHVILVAREGVHAHLNHSGESFDYLLPGDSELVSGDWCDPYAGINQE